MQFGSVRYCILSWGKRKRGGRKTHLDKVEETDVLGIFSHEYTSSTLTGPCAFQLRAKQFEMKVIMMNNNERYAMLGSLRVGQLSCGRPRFPQTAGSWAAAGAPVKNCSGAASAGCENG